MDYSGGGQGALREMQGAEEVSGKKTHIIFWFSFFGIVFIIIIIALFLIFSHSDSKKVSEKKLIEGVALEVGDNDVVKFDLDKEEHGMWINFMGYDSVELTISSEPINLTLQINEVKEVDLNNDGIFDIRIKLVKIEDGKATIAFQKLEKETCREDWKCSDWENCSKGFQKRECKDLNSCGTIFDKPSVKKGCLEIEFVENNSAFDGQLNNNGSNILNNSINKTIDKNLNNTHPVNFTNGTTSSNLTNHTSVNNHPNETNITINHPIIINNTSNTTNSTISNNPNSTNTSGSTICPQNTYICQEYYGFFCGVYHDSNSINPFCCPKECLRFNSKEQLCSARGYLYFTGNETHICKVQVYSLFNGTNILCCASIENKVNLNSTGLSS
jgi:hypothetical protein